MRVLVPAHGRSSISDASAGPSADSVPDGGAWEPDHFTRQRADIASNYALR